MIVLIAAEGVSLASGRQERDSTFVSTRSAPDGHRRKVTAGRSRPKVDQRTRTSHAGAGSPCGNAQFRAGGWNVDSPVTRSTQGQERRLQQRDPATTRTKRTTTGKDDEGMRFLSMIRIDENTGKVPSEQLMSDMGKLIEEATRDGTLITTAGLRPTAEGVRVRLRNGKLATVDGPFTETKEVIGGFAIIEAKSKQEAIEMTMRFLKIHGDEWDIECEVREFDGPAAGTEA
jgi:hypothetical protein